MKSTIKIAILGGGEEELSILSEFHRTPGIDIIAIYDRDPRAVALEIAEIIGVPTYSNNSFLTAFHESDYIIVTEKRETYKEEIALLQRSRKRIINPSEAVSCLVAERQEEGKTLQAPWPAHLEEAIQYINRITDRERLLKWLLEISVRGVEASSGSIMLYSERTKELYIGYATGLSPDIVKKTRQRIGKGIAGRVAETGNAILIKEIVDVPMHREYRERQEIQSAISTPLMHEGVLLGVLNVSTNKGEKKLNEEDVRTIELLASKIAPILEQHLRIDAHEIKEIEYEIRNYLESLMHREIEFHEKFTLLCKLIVEKLSADTVTIYTATDEGDWLILGGSDRHMPIGVQSPRIHCIKGSLARAYLSRQEVMMTEAKHDVSLKLKAKNGSITSIYIPLMHNEPLGVLVIEFSNLEALERFFKLKDSLSFQVSLFSYSILRELRQLRKMESLEQLSALTPTLMELNGITNKIGRLPELLSSLVSASLGSIHYIGPGIDETAYYRFPREEHEKTKTMDYDSDLFKQVMSKWEVACTSFMSVDVEMQDKPPLYSSIIVYPLFRSEDSSAVYIGYNKAPSTPLDSSIFGEHEIDLLNKVSDILTPLFLSKRKDKKDEIIEEGQWTFDDLLRSNQKILIEHIEDEIERAKRYHHGFTLTLFKISGLKDLFERDSQEGLGLINKLSLGIREKVRKTDYFSWIETDLFSVLSLESYHRIGYLEGRLNGFITDVLQDTGLFEPCSFYPTSSYVLFPGSSETPGELIDEAKSKL